MWANIASIEALGLLLSRAYPPASRVEESA